MFRDVRFSVSEVFIVIGLVLIFLASNGCALMEIEDRIDEAVETCEAIAQRERNAALAECALLLDEQIALLEQKCSEQVGAAVAALEKQLPEWIDDAIQTLMEQIGCIPDTDADTGWNCAPICFPS